MNVLGEIKNSLWNGRMAHAYILEAPAGETRDRLMTNILQEILCRNPNLEQRPCGLCEACRRVAAGSHEDVIYMKKSKLEEGKTKQQSNLCDEGYRTIHGSATTESVWRTKYRCNSGCG